jgi:hypothetical protein
MKSIASQLQSTFLQLFPTRKLRLILTSLVFIAAFVSVSELAVAKLFTSIILNENEIDSRKLVILVVLFFFFFTLTRLGQFFQRIYRLRVFDKAFQVSEETLSYSKENWRWSLAIELSSVLSTITQMTAIMLLFTYLSPLFGLINAAVVLITLTVLGHLFEKQMEAQRGFVKAKKDKKPVANSIRVSTRIRMGETGILIGGASMILLLAALLYLHYIDLIGSGNVVVLFLGLRMQNSNLSGISTGLMRFARARTHSE